MMLGPATPPPIASPSMPVFQLLISGPISSGEGARPAFSGCITNGRGAGDEEEQEWPALLLRDQAGQRREAARFQSPLVLTPADVGGGGASPRLLGLMCCRGVVSSASPGGSGAGSRGAEQERRQPRQRSSGPVRAELTLMDAPVVTIERRD
jgi:hypothetical protein